jgi:hypothetical protein
LQARAIVACAALLLLNAPTLSLCEDVVNLPAENNNEDLVVQLSVPAADDGATTTTTPRLMAPRRVRARARRARPSLRRGFCFLLAGRKADACDARVRRVLKVISQEKSKLSLVVLPVLAFCLFFNIAFSAAHVASLSLAQQTLCPTLPFCVSKPSPPPPTTDECQVEDEGEP